MAATSSLCGKFSMAAQHVLLLCENVSQLFFESDEFSYNAFCQNFIVLTRIGFFVAMILSNVLMWTLFTKALRLCSTTLEASVTNTAANFFFTAIYGQVFFGESLTFIWWFGTMLIIMGLLVMHRANEEAKAETDSNKKKN